MSIEIEQKCTIHTCIGVGQSTALYQASLHATNQRCLVLLIRLPLISRSAKSRFFHRFHRITSQLLSLPHHPGIVPLWDCGVSSDVGYLIYPGDDFVQSNVAGCTPREIMKEMCTVALAVEHAHLHGGVHGNLTSRSLLWANASNKEMRVIGFGLRAILVSQGIEQRERGYGHLRSLWGTYLGDPSALAPECVLGSVPDTRSDIYAFGLLISSLLTGERKPRKDYLREATTALYAPLKSIPNISSPIQTMVGDLMALRPEDRSPLSLFVKRCRAYLSTENEDASHEHDLDSEMKR